MAEHGSPPRVDLFRVARIVGSGVNLGVKKTGPQKAPVPVCLGA
jgi:hypothetical protein